MQRQSTQFIVGLFVIFAILCFIFLVFKVSGLTSFSTGSSYEITADFNNIGGLKVRAPVRISGVSVGQVSSITLDPNTFQAKVTMSINSEENKIPVDTSASIFTEGLLGANYINLTPGYEDNYFKEGGKIKSTKSALILENLLGQLLFNVKK